MDPKPKAGALTIEDLSRINALSADVITSSTPLAINGFRGREGSNHHESEELASSFGREFRRRLLRRIGGTMIDHVVQVQAPGQRLEREDQLAWKIAEVASAHVECDVDVHEMIINRLIDNAAVSLVSVARRPVKTARSQALARQQPRGSTLFGCNSSLRIAPEWAAWANGVTVRELDFHDTFLSVEYAHPGDNIPPLVAIAQYVGSAGEELMRAIATSYEIQVDLAKSISLHAHKIDHVAHLGPSIAAGLGTLLNLPTEVTFQAIGQALHVTTSTRQSRKGEISSWKAFAPAFAGKMAIEAVDRCMRGEGSPAPIYEGEDGVIAQLLDGADARYVVSLPESHESRSAILETYTKAYSAEYQAQALIDLAFRMRSRIADTAAIERITIHTSYHTHFVIGTGANDPEKFDPNASRETLDHSAMYIFAVALEDGEWHHERSYSRERASRPSTISLWNKIETLEDEQWNRRYHTLDLAEKAFGAKVVVEFLDGTQVVDELAVADAHPLGAHPFKRLDYIKKFQTLAEGVIDEDEQMRFLEAAENLGSLSGLELAQLNITVPETVLIDTQEQAGLF